MVTQNMWWRKRWEGKSLSLSKRENGAKMSEKDPGDCVNRGPPGEKWRNGVRR